MSGPVQPPAQPARVQAPVVPRIETPPTPTNILPGKCMLLFLDGKLQGERVVDIRDFTDEWPMPDDLFVGLNCGMTTGITADMDELEEGPGREVLVYSKDRDTSFELAKNQFVVGAVYKLREGGPWQVVK